VSRDNTRARLARSRTARSAFSLPMCPLVAMLLSIGPCTCPKSWTGDPARLHVPDAVAFATKPALAVEMIKRALAVDVPFSWIAADAVYGVGDVEQVLRRACKGYVLGLNPTTTSAHGQGSPRLPARPRRSRRTSTQTHGYGFPLARAPKALASTTGLTSNSPISTPTNMMRRNQGFGPAAC
jgi:hypothetical protein